MRLGWIAVVALGFVFVACADKEAKIEAAYQKCLAKADDAADKAGAKAQAENPLGRGTIVSGPTPAGERVSQAHTTARAACQLMKGDCTKDYYGIPCQAVINNY